MLNTGLLFLVLSTAQPEPAAESVPSATSASQPGPAEPAKTRPAKPPSDNEGQAGEFFVINHEAAFLAMFTEGAIQYTGRGYRERSFKYRLFVPDLAGPDDKRPLIVWLHGRGEAGDDNSSHLRHLSTMVFTKPWERQRYPFFLLAVQCPRDNSVWTTSADDADDMLNVLMVVLDKTLQEQPIDRDRITLGGVSSGGSGAWEFAMREPERFAAVAPLASGGGDAARLGNLAQLPIWAFHSTKDPGTPVELVRSTVSQLKSAGGNVHLTEVNLRMHDCWRAAFERYELLPWLLAQKRGDPSSRAPGTVSTEANVRLAWIFLSTGWTPVKLLGQIGIPLLLIAAIWSARRQRRLRRSREPSGIADERSGSRTEGRKGHEGSQREH